MRIVIATAVYYPMINGVAVFSHNLAVGLAKRGHEALVLCPSQTGKNYTRVEDGVKVARLKSVDIKVYPDQIHSVPEKKKFLGIRLPHLWYKKGFRVSVFPSKEIKKALNDFNPDVVHVQVSDPVGLSVISWARKMGVPVVTTEHNQPEVLTEPLHLPGLVRKPTNAILSAYFRNRQSKSDFVTMPTKQAIDNLILSKGKEFPVPVAAVSNGVDLSNFKPGKASKRIYEKYNISNEGLKVLYVGRVDPEKKVGLVIEAFNKARKFIPKNTELIITGDGVDRVRLEKVAADLGISDVVRFLGRVLPPDLYEIYKIGDVFITASEIETQGIVLIEAAASGLPLIAVNKGAVSEVCITNENGYLCKPGDVSELSEALVSILTDDKLREKFSSTSVKISKEHDFEVTLDRFINIYNRVVKK
ncbi:MAG: glycosyltransferase [Candidatus Saccharibacteria bacterium]|nr:glycosyltransferase [Candidatus Saccharibacteria bacterium]